MSNAGKVEYTLRANDDQIEADLERANKKVEKSAQKSADDTIKVEQEKTRGINQENQKNVKNAESAASDVTGAWKDAGSDAKKAMSNIADDTDIDIDVDANTGKAESAIKNVSRDKRVGVDVDADASKADANIKDLGDTGEKVSKQISDGLSTALRNAAGVAKESFSGMAASALPFGENIGALTSGLSGTAMATLGVGTAVVGVGAMAVNVAADMDSAMNTFLSTTGKSRDETEKYQGVLEDIYKNNYGESFDDIAQSMAVVTKNLGDLNDTDLQNVTESAFALRDTFGYEIPESTRAAKAMMENFGISGDDAMSMIAAGAQNGLDYSGELLDSISEYSVQFEKVGLSADDMFKMFEKGAESGAFNLDKVGDAVKEFSIRAIDGSNTTIDGFDKLGLNADEMASKFAAGGDTAKEAFMQVIQGLADMDDPVEQSIAGVDLFGTMWEDLGPEAVTALADIEDGAYDTAEAMDGIKDIKYDDLASMFEELSRNVELLLLPLGEALMPILMMLIDTVLPIITEVLSPLLSLISSFLEPILMLISAALQPLIDIFVLLIDIAIKPLVSVLQDFLLPIFEGVFSSILDTVNKNIDRVKVVLSGVIDFVKSVFKGDWEGAWKAVLKVFNNLPSSFREVSKSITGVFKGIINFVKSVFKGDWEGAWKAVKSIFKNAFDGFAAIAKTPINAVIGIVNGFIAGLNKLKIPDWIPGIGGKGINIPTIPRLKVGMDYVPGDDFPALLHEGEMVLTKKDASQLRELGGIDGVMSMLSQDAKLSIVGGIADGNLNLLEQLIQKITETNNEYRFTAVVEMDGKQLAKGTSTYNDIELARLAGLGKRGV